MAPTVGQVAAACHGEVIAGDPELLGREALHLMVAAMTLPNLIDRITDGAVLITPGDRAEVLLAAMFAHASTVLPSPAGVVLTGGLRPPETILGALGSFGGIVPVILTEHDTYETVSLGERARGRDHPRRPAQDHQGAGAVRDPCRRRRPARPHRRRAVGRGDAADVRVHAAGPGAGGGAAHRPARGRRRPRAAGGGHPPAPAGGRADAPRAGGGGAGRGVAAGAGSVRRAHRRSVRAGAIGALRRRVRGAAGAQGRHGRPGPRRGVATCATSGR